ncbi:zinc finger domain-containing protein [Streptomyces shenzhenensis]
MCSPRAARLSHKRAAAAVERYDCPSCAAPVGSACRTRGGKTAAKYRTPRFGMVPAQREELDVSVPADRGPGRTCRHSPALAVVPAPRAERALRIGYARTSTTRQELAPHFDALRPAECHKIFQEQISTRVKVRPELKKAPAPAHLRLPRHRHRGLDPPVAQAAIRQIKQWSSAQLP